MLVLASLIRYNPRHDRDLARLFNRGGGGGVGPDDPDAHTAPPDRTGVLDADGRSDDRGAGRPLVSRRSVSCAGPQDDGPPQVVDHASRTSPTAGARGPGSRETLVQARGHRVCAVP